MSDTSCVPALTRPEMFWVEGFNERASMSHHSACLSEKPHLYHANTCANALREKTCARAHTHTHTHTHIRNIVTSIRLLIHPQPLIRSRVTEVQGTVSAGAPDFPLPGHISQLWLGDLEVFPSHYRDIIFPLRPGSTPGPLPSWTRSLPDTWTTSSGSFQCKGAVALLQVPHRGLNFSLYLLRWRRPPSWRNPFQPLVSAMLMLNTIYSTYHINTSV